MNERNWGFKAGLFVRKVLRLKPTRRASKEISAQRFVAYWRWRALMMNLWPVVLIFLILGFIFRNENLGQSFLSLFFGISMGGGLGLAGFIWAINRAFDSKAFPLKSWTPWIVTVIENQVRIETPVNSTAFMLGDAQECEFWLNGDWDSEAAAEDTFLRVGLPNKLFIVIPGSAKSFDLLLEKAKALSFFTRCTT